MVKLKKRYFLCKMYYPEGVLIDEFDGSSFMKALRQEIGTNFGDFGYGVCTEHVRLKKTDLGAGYIIVGSAAGVADMVGISLTTIKSIRFGNRYKPVRFHIRLSSGTLQGVRKAMLRDLLALRAHQPMPLEILAP